MNKEYKKYIDEKKEDHETLLSFLENHQDDDIDLDSLMTNIKNEKLEINREELYHFLQLIVNIANNHHRDINFNNKIQKMLQFLKDEITQTFSNNEIFHIFKNNKLITLYLFEIKIIFINDDIIAEIMYEKYLDNKEYCLYFYPEIKSFIGEDKSDDMKKDLLNIDQNIFNDFDEKRHIGENDSYICSLIRQDLVEEFIGYVNKNLYNLSKHITPSLFETNPFLIGKTPTLIEYAAFFGSIQIFQYLIMNKVELKSSLWLYLIHSNNAEMIHLLEANNVPINEIYEECLIESIKCHHNGIANYLIDTKSSDLNGNLSDDDFASIYAHSNYSFFSYDIDKNHVFFYLCLNYYFNLVELYMKAKEKEIENIIEKEIYFLYNLVQFFF